jgi:hypothetical protein
MAGTIRKVTTNSLMYSNESSGIFSNSVTVSQSSGSIFEEDLDSDIMEFDLRDDSVDGIIRDCLIDAPTGTQSEAVEKLMEAPDVSVALDSSSMHTSTRPQEPEPVPSWIREPDANFVSVKRDASKLAQLVDQLLDSPRVGRKDTTKSRSPIFPVQRAKVGAAGVVPLAVRNRSADQLEDIPSLKVKSPTFMRQGRKQTADSWVCPDSWIPNHQCDSFCWETLRSTYN